MAFNIKLLRQRKSDALAKAGSISETITAAGDDATKAQRDEYDAQIALVATLNGDIKRAETLMDEERNAPASAVASASIPEAAHRPWKNSGEFFHAVAVGTKYFERGNASRADARLQAALGSSESVPSDGGFLVPTEQSNEILQRAYDESLIMGRAREMRMNTARQIIPAVDEDSRSDGSRFGGIQAYYRAEAANYTGTKPKFREIQLVANELIGLTYATNELLDDTALWKSWVDATFPMEFAFKWDSVAFSGTGAGQPLGISTCPALIVQAKDTSQPTATLSASNVTNMWSRLWGKSRLNAVWFINQSIEPQLLTLTLGAPSLGQILLYTPPGERGNNSKYGLMMGCPVIPIEQSNILGTQGDLTLADMTQYIHAIRTDIESDSSIHVAFLTGETAFRWTMRHDGQPWWKKPLSPYTPAGGTTPPTLSPFVQLAARP